MNPVVPSALPTDGFTHSEGGKKIKAKNRKVILTLTNCNTSSFFGIIVSSKRFSLNENMKHSNKNGY